MGNEKSIYIKNLDELKDKVFVFYDKYYKNEVEKQNYPSRYTKNNRSNKFLIELEECLTKFLGSDNHPKWETLGNFLIDADYDGVSENTISSLKSYCENVDRVLEIRKFKKRIKNYFLKNSCDQLDVNKPIEFSKILSNELYENSKDIDLDILRNDIETLLSEDEKHYEIKNSSIKILEEFLEKKYKQANNDSQSIKLNDQIEEKEKESTWGKVIIFLLSKKRKIGYVIGFLFSWFPYISLPIASIGLYQTAKLKDSKRKKIRFAIYILMFLFSLILPLYFIYETTEIWKSPKGKFNTYTADEDIGFVAIGNGNYMSKEPIKQYDEITLPMLKNKEKYYFTISIYFRNVGVSIIYNAKAEISLNIQNDIIFINGKLIADNAKTITDLAKIRNIPILNSILMINGSIGNEGLSVDLENCSGSRYEMHLNSNFWVEGVTLGDLGAEQNGLCDRGSINILMSIENLGEDMK